MSDYDSRTSDEELAGLGQLTSLFRQLRSLGTKPSWDVPALLGRLGIPIEEASKGARLLESLRHVRVTEPGQVVDDNCELGWQPSVLAPVFYGSREISLGSGPPLRVRIYFPSTDGAPDSAGLLAGCGRYPLVLFLQGQCAEHDHFLKWELFGTRLARAGYVVVVPDLAQFGSPWDESSPQQLADLEQLLIWMRGSWEFADSLMPSPATAVVGHSFGALWGGLLIVRQVHPIASYVSLSGGWRQWTVPTPPNPLPRLGTVSLFVWGTGVFDPVETNSDLGHWWDQLDYPRHRLVFRPAGHWDYLGSNGTSCATWQEGDCPAFVRDLAADFVVMFLSHYLPPEKWWLLPVSIPHSLIPPPLDATAAQQRFLGGHLAGFARTTGGGSCRATHSWQVNANEGSITLTGS